MERLKAELKTARIHEMEANIKIIDLSAEVERLRTALREAVDHIQAYKDVCHYDQIMRVNQIILDERAGKL